MYFRTMLDDKFFTAQQLAALRRHGYDVDADNRVQLVKAEHPWTSAGRLRREEAFRCVDTWYDKEDIDAAPYIRVYGMPRYGWPLPELDFREYVYAEGYCLKCGANPIQIRPYEIKRAPRRIHRHAFELWNTYRLMVTNDVYESIFRPLGVDRTEVWKRSDKKPIAEISQLVINQKIDLELQEFDILETCGVCGSIKYDISPFFGFYRPIGADFDIAESKQSFGGGWLSFPAIVISNAVYKKIVAHGVRGFIFQPCRSVWGPDRKIGVLQPNYLSI